MTYGLKHVGLADYQGFYEDLGGGAAFGIGGPAFGNPEVVAELNKAMGTTSNNGGVAGATNVLIPQSLETTLQVISFQLKELKLWNRIAKAPAYAINEEYDVLNSYGGDELGFIEEGGLPAEDDSDISKVIEKVKFMGTTRAVTHPMTLVNTISGIQSAIDLEDQNGTMQILRNLEIALFEGDETVNPLSINGIFKHVKARAPQNILDLRGKPITDAVCQEVDQFSADNFGELDVAYMSTRQKNNLSQMLQANKRNVVGVSPTNVSLGVNTDKFVGNNSAFDLEGHKFLRAGGPPPTNAKTGAPGTPVGVTGAAVDTSDSLLQANTYNYKVTAVNNKGESLATANVAVVVAAAGDTAEITIPQTAGAVLYRIYRADGAGATSHKYLDKIKAENGPTVYQDKGTYLPGCSKAYFLKTDPREGLRVRQLAPLMKLPLAQIDTKMRWAILLYLALQVYQPRKQFVLINVGDDAVDHPFPDYLTPANF